MKAEPLLERMFREWELRGWDRGNLLAFKMSAGNTYENAYLDAAYGNSHTPRFPGIVYLALFTVAPTDAGGGTEVVGGSYSRVAIVNNSTNFPDAVGGTKSNGTVITFPTATANWGDVTHFAIMDAATGGAIIDWGALTAPITVNSGNTPQWLVNQLVLTAD